MDLGQKENDITAQTNIALGGSPIDAQGDWNGRWQAAKTGSAQNVTIELPAASAIIIHFQRSK